MAEIPKEMKPIIKNNKIINLRQVIEAIRESSDNELLKEFIDEIKIFSANKEIDGIEELKAAITIRVQELEQQKASNKNVLDSLKQQNPNLNGLSIIETKKEQNDCGAAIDYIKYVDEYGVVQILECREASTLNDFISENLELAISGGALEIFDYFRKYKHASLRFKDVEEKTATDVKIELDKMKISDPRINNENDFLEEKRLIEEFALNEANNIIPRIAINSHGERIYTVGETVIKFMDAEGKRKMDIISGNTYQKEEVNRKSAIIENSESITSEQKASETSNKEPVLIGESEAYRILGALCSGEEITTEERKELEFFLNHTISLMADSPLPYDSQNIVDTYIYSYLELREDEPGWSSEERKINNRYQKTIKDNEEAKEIAEKQGKKDGEVRALRFILPDNTKGIILAIVILEVTALLGVLIAALALANR